MKHLFLVRVLLNAKHSRNYLSFCPQSTCVDVDYLVNKLKAFFWSVSYECFLLLHRLGAVADVELAIWMKTIREDIMVVGSPSLIAGSLESTHKVNHVGELRLCSCCLCAYTKQCLSSLKCMLCI